MLLRHSACLSRLRSSSSPGRYSTWETKGSTFGWPTFQKQSRRRFQQRMFSTSRMATGEIIVLALIGFVSVWDLDVTFRLNRVFLKCTRQFAHRRFQISLPPDLTTTRQRRHLPRVRAQLDPVYECSRIWRRRSGHRSSRGDPSFDKPHGYPGLIFDEGDLKWRPRLSRELNWRLMVGCPSANGLLHLGRILRRTKS